MISHWTYTRLSCGQIEAAVRRATVALPQAAHFHDDVQIVAVRQGWRAFVTPVGEFVAQAGDIVVIPAGLLHAPRMSARSVVSNLYVAPTDPAVHGIAMPMALSGVGAVRAADILDAVGSRPRGLPRPMHQAHASEMRRIVVETDLSMPDIAERLGYSTDGFIRVFKRATGITPAGYRRLHRLNAARRLLRGGARPAEAACAASFADQSHLGRFFLKAYGATPGAYRAGFRDGAAVDFVPDL